MEASLEDGADAEYLVGQLMRICLNWDGRVALRIASSSSVREDSVRKLVLGTSLDAGVPGKPTGCGDILALFDGWIDNIGI